MSSGRVHVPGLGKSGGAASSRTINFNPIVCLCIRAQVVCVGQRGYLTPSIPWSDGGERMVLGLASSTCFLCQIRYHRLHSAIRFVLPSSVEPFEGTDCTVVMKFECTVITGLDVYRVHQNSNRSAIRILDLSFFSSQSWPKFWRSVLIFNGFEIRSRQKKLKIYKICTIPEKHRTIVQFLIVLSIIVLHHIPREKVGDRSTKTHFEIWDLYCPLNHFQF